MCNNIGIIFVFLLGFIFMIGAVRNILYIRKIKDTKNSKNRENDRIVLHNQSRLSLIFSLIFILRRYVNYDFSFLGIVLIVFMFIDVLYFLAYSFKSKPVDPYNSESMLDLYVILAIIDCVWMAMLSM